MDNNKLTSRNIHINDDELVRECQLGDLRAMEHLIVKYKDRLFNTILKICNNYDDAAELTQDTFVKVFEKIGSFEGKSSFYTWAFRIAVNLAINHCRRQMKIRFKSIDEPRPAGENGEVSVGQMLAGKTEEDPAVILHKKEVGRQVLAALDQLEEEYRVIIVLRDVEGMSYLEISAVLELELGTVKSRLSRARAALRDLLMEH